MLAIKITYMNSSLQDYDVFTHTGNARAFILGILDGHNRNRNRNRDHNCNHAMEVNCINHCPCSNSKSDSLKLKFSYSFFVLSPLQLQF